ncbi:MAG TPA: AMP-binding protein, partial [Hyphomicrobiaceae bacterium]|nr:AMP-binding protein [Hyphomicrobiaceae bacterium]
MARVFDPRASRATLFSALLAAKRQHGGDKAIIEDVERQPLTYSRIILGSFVLGGRLAAMTRRKEAVGVLLPNVAGLAVVLFGLNAYGRVAAMLNFTAGVRNLRSALRTAEVRTIVTSRRFIATAKLEDVVAALAETETAKGGKVRIVYLEDVRKEIGAKDKIGGVIRAAMAARVHRKHGLGPDDPAVILFTSGTEGEPKGVVLSSANLVANAAQIYAHADGALSPADVIFNPLPMFHSFGLTAGSLVGLLNGIKVVLYPSPLHFHQIPELIAATKATFLFATDTFAQSYARAAGEGELASVRYVIAGAEKVKDQTRSQWAKFGALVLEGYGATECSPVIACSLPDANCAGSVGRALPGMELRLEAVEGITDGGRLYVRGPNVMSGYMMSKYPGVLVPPEGGWHDTGDIVAIDADGFLTIKGRAKRFAKVGGEMISLAAVEGVVASLWPEASHVVVSL